MIGMNDPRSLKYERFNGYESEEARQRKIGSRVLIAGAGGGGAELAQLLVKEGYQDLTLIDGDTYSETDYKIPLVNSDMLGKPKVEALRDRLLSINEDANVRVFNAWFGPDNAEDFFMKGYKKGQPVVAVDEIDLLRTGPAAALHFAQTARKYDIPVTSITDIGKRGATVTSYDPKSKYTYERVNGLPKDATYQTMVEIAQKGEAPDLSNIAYLPTNGSLDTLLAVQNGASLPTTPGSVMMGANLGASEIERIIFDGQFNAKKPTWAPRVRWYDIDAGVGETRFPRVSYYRHLATAAFKDKVLKVNPPASYTPEDIEKRRQFRNEALEIN